MRGSQKPGTPPAPTGPGTPSGTSALSRLGTPPEPPGTPITGKGFPGSPHVVGNPGTQPHSEWRLGDDS